MSDYQLPPQSEWINLSLMQLYDARSHIINTYYNMKSVNASFANQYLVFLDKLTYIIRDKETSKDTD